MKTMLKAALGAALLAGTTLAPDAAFAQAAGGDLFVDVNRVYAESSAGRSGQAQIKAKYEANLRTAATSFNAAASVYNAQVEAAKKVLQPNGSLPDANQRALGDAQQKLQAADDNLTRLQNEVNNVGRYVQSQVLEKTLPIAEQIRAERKASSVVAKGSVLASDPAADVTATVIQRLNGQMAAVSIVLPQENAPAAAAPRPAAPANTQGR